MRKWRLERVNGELVVKPTIPLYCPFCGERMLLHDFHAYLASDGFYHVDVHMKCPECDFWAVFGVPISREEHDMLHRSRYHGRILRDELRDIETIDERIIRRLKEWGYW